MSVEHVKRVTCDRCGKVVELPAVQFVNDPVKYEGLPAFWGMCSPRTGIAGITKVLCPDCLMLWDDLIEDFFECYEEEGSGAK